MYNEHCVLPPFNMDDLCFLELYRIIVQTINCNKRNIVQYLLWIKKAIYFPVHVPCQFVGDEVSLRIQEENYEW